MTLHKGQDVMHRLFIVILLSVLLLIITYRVFKSFYPIPDSGGIENNIIYFIQRCLDGHVLYDNPEAPPYAIAQYSPLYYYLASLTATIFGVHSSDVMQLFIVNRLLSLFLNGLLAILIGYTGKTIFHFSGSVRAIVSVFVFCFFEFYSRPDSLGHLFWFSSLHFFLKSIQSDGAKNRLLFLSAVFAVLGILSKQNAVTILLIAFTWLLLQQQFKAALRFGFICFFLLGAGLGLLALLNKPEDVYGNIILGLNNGFALTNYWYNFIVHFYSANGFIFLVAMLVVCYFLWKEKQPIFRFLAWTILSQFLLSNLFALKYGSGINYLTEWMLLLFLATGIYTERLNSILEKILPYLGLVLLISVLMMRAIPVISRFAYESKFSTYSKASELFQTESRVASYLKLKHPDRPFSVFNNLYSPESFLNNFLYRESLIPQYDIVHFTTYKRRVYDYSFFEKQVNEGLIDHVVIKYPDTLPRFFELSFKNYRKDTVIREYTIFSSVSR